LAKILVIEDDAMMASAISEILEADGHVVTVVYDGSAGFNSLKNEGFDLAIIDWQLPGLEGPEICARYRIKNGKIPVLMLTQKSNVVDKATGLECGADDYLTKPFDLREFRARVKALLRRSSGYFEEKREVGQVSLDRAEKTLTFAGRRVQLLPREFELIEFLMRHPHTFFTAESLLDHVWKSEANVGEQALRTCLSRLRSKVDEPGKPSLIETVKGFGYKISEIYLKNP